MSNGAHHVHDYVGNTVHRPHGDRAVPRRRGHDLPAATTGRSTSGRCCGTSSTAAQDADRPGGGQDGNLGHIVTPAAVSVDFLGNPRAPVTPMPRFLRIVTGNAKAATTGDTRGPDGRCSGTPGRASGTHYPLCPAGQLVQRTGEFPSCWNGADIDSETHRTHVTFPDPATGACPAGTVAIPRLRVTVGYHVPPGRSYAIDSFPDQQRKPLTDHFDFLNVMPEPLMRHAVDCINTGRTC